MSTPIEQIGKAAERRFRDWCIENKREELLDSEMLLAEIRVIAKHAARLAALMTREHVNLELELPQAFTGEVVRVARPGE